MHASACLQLRCVTFGRSITHMTCVDLWSNGTDLLKVLSNTQQRSTDAGDVAVDAGARLMGLDYQGWADA